MSILRWKFEEGGDTWVMPVNPNSASSPYAPRTMTATHGQGSGGINRIRLMETASGPGNWQFGGPIYTKQHHDLLLDWSKRDAVISVSTHLGHTFEVIISKLELTERRPTPTKPWRLTYQVSALVMGRVQ